MAQMMQLGVDPQKTYIIVVLFDHHVSRNQNDEHGTISSNHYSFSLYYHHSLITSQRLHHGPNPPSHQFIFFSTF
ncbi:hypothetical protein YC2023_007075 [Brassica napus]